jgi:hypothetical protein
MSYYNESLWIEDEAGYVQKKVNFAFSYGIIMSVSLICVERTAKKLLNKFNIRALGLFILLLFVLISSIVANISSYYAWFGSSLTSLVNDSIHRNMYVSLTYFLLLLFIVDRANHFISNKIFAYSQSFVIISVTFSLLILTFSYLSKYMSDLIQGISSTVDSNNYTLYQSTLNYICTIYIEIINFYIIYIVYVNLSNLSSKQEILIIVMKNLGINFLLIIISDILYIATNSESINLVKTGFDTNSKVFFNESICVFYFLSISLTIYNIVEWDAGAIQNIFKDAANIKSKLLSSHSEQNKSIK